MKKHMSAKKTWLTWDCFLFF